MINIVKLEKIMNELESGGKPYSTVIRPDKEVIISKDLLRELVYQIYLSEV